MKKNIAILTGAGISAESGIQTFRDSNGLWENHSIEDVATPEGWRRNPTLVLEFYNQRRALLATVNPNAGHLALKKLEEKYHVCVITQNVDDLHERAGSSKVLHLHGELLKARDSYDPTCIVDWPKDIKIGDKSPKGGQLRPHIVWFGEEVPMLHTANVMMYDADIAIIIGTTMQVYPAAGIIQYAKPNTPIYYIDPNPATLHDPRIKVLKGNATVEVPKLVEKLLKA